MKLYPLALILVWVFMMSACDSLPLSSVNTDDATTEAIAVGLTPQETVEEFLTAWSDEEFEQMYSLLNSRSAQVYPLDDFISQYEIAHTAMGFIELDYVINDIRVQGTSAAVDYDVLLQTTTFATIQDNARTMRLVQDANGWTIAWSPMDIINGMTTNVRLDPNRSFAVRGNIYDRNGQYLVNELGTTYAIRLVLSDMADVDACTALLSRITLRSQAYFRDIYIDYQAAGAAFFVGEIDELTHNRYRSDLDAVCGTDINIVGLIPPEKIVPRIGRTYFGQGAATHITGYVGSVPADNVAAWRARGYYDTDLVGLAGIEYTYQDVLAGVPDQSLRLIDRNSGVILRDFGSSSGTESAPVTLTIDRDLQWHTAQAFIDAWNYAAPNWVTRARGGAAIVMDVNSGAILAMFSFPTFDPSIFYPESTYWSTGTVKAFAAAQVNYAYNGDRFLPLEPATRNLAYSEQHSPGSVYKILTTLATADSNTWSAETLFPCNLTWDGSAYGDTAGIREDWRKALKWEPAGEVTMATALTTSCNPFFYQMGALMYQENPSLFSDYLNRWGFGQRTGLIGLDAETEASGNNPIPNAPYQAINNAIGQGDTKVTVLQMARLVSAVANGGTLYQPYIVQRVGTQADPLEVIDPVVMGQLGVSDDALRITREGMCQVPIDSFYGTSYAIFAGSEDIAPSYTSCGKTGTAEANPLPPIAWYAAFAPAEEPQIAVVVVVPNSREGSEVSAPIVRRILDHYFDAPIASFPEWWAEDYNPLELPGT